MVCIVKLLARVWCEGRESYSRWSSAGVRLAEQDGAAAEAAATVARAPVRVAGRAVLRQSWEACGSVVGAQGLSAGLLSRTWSSRLRLCRAAIHAWAIDDLDVHDPVVHDVQGEDALRW